MLRCFLTLCLKSYSFHTLEEDQSSTENRGNIQFQESNTFVPTEEANNTGEKRKYQEGNTVKEHRKIEIVNSSNASGLQGQKMQQKAHKNSGNLKYNVGLSECSAVLTVF
jgi:hypothetical protein